ncbi:TRAP transporter large permease subunit [Clostridium bovifaecis]|uniref:TRAP transporter large permease subunit n=1 Tax=Clostridium bovifaecis TaxID=2184719 RepID=A0A6I6F1D8_9CLOT|nr:TRAP transporter large permease subunit [Clostridium bovifaecis]
MVALLMAVLMISLFLGFPLMVGLLLGPLAVLTVYMPDIQPFWLTGQVSAGVESFVLMAVPMFIFAADIMGTGQTSNRLLDFVNTFVGHIKGGLAITTAATCTLFGAISGSTQATVVAVGKPMHEKLLKVGYRGSDVYALIINSANIALLIPPSVVMIMYAVMTGVSVGELFIAGVGPGLLVLFFFSIYNYFDAKRKNIPVMAKSTWSEKLAITKKALLPLGFPAIIVGGIYLGLFSPTEAAAASVLYAAILELFVYKSITFKDIPKIALSSGMVTAVVFILVAAGMGFAWIISLARIPQLITSTLLGPNPSAYTVLWVVTAAFFIGCMFCDQLVVIIILAPIFAGPAIAAGIDPIHLGIVITLQAAIGSATPPFGCNIFTAAAVFKRPYLEIIRNTAPYFVMYAAISAIMIYFPQIALVTRNLLY